MPNKPDWPCRYPGCPNLTDHPRGYCSEHLPFKYREEDLDRLSPSERGYDSRWNRVRAFYLAHNPLCVECLSEGRVEAATVVDHIRPHKGDKMLFWCEDNWQSLCKMHHDRKTAKEDGAFGNSL
jgi:5-methylcytosine-specific restriction enzyme A